MDRDDAAALAHLIKPATRSELSLAMTFVRAALLAANELTLSSMNGDPAEMRAAWDSYRRADAEMVQFINFLRGEAELPNG